MKRLHILLLLLAVTGLTACHSNKVSEEFLLTPGLCLEENGRMVFNYNPDNCQIACNPDRKQFRVMDDTMSRFYLLTCSALPSSVGQVLTADIRWVSGDSAQNLAGLEFKVEKLEDGQAWLWCQRRKIAVSVRLLP